jgi:hypothetical protein
VWADRALPYGLIVNFPRRAELVLLALFDDNIIVRNIIVRTRQLDMPLS